MKQLIADLIIYIVDRRAEKAVPRQTTGIPFRAWVFQDRSANTESREGLLIVTWFRLAQWSYEHWGWFGRRFAGFYFLFTSLFFSVEIPIQARIGRGLRLYHPHSIVLPTTAILGDGVTLRQGVTLGTTKHPHGEVRSPVVGDRVDFGANSMVVGRVFLGNDSRVGMGAVVTKNVPARATVVGNPATPITNGVSTGGATLGLEISDPAGSVRAEVIARAVAERARQERYLAP